MTGDVEHKECESCGWDTTELKLSQMAGADFERWLCVVCFSTLAGNASLFPAHYGNQAATLRTIAWATNYLASKIVAAVPR